MAKKQAKRRKKHSAKEKAAYWGGVGMSIARNHGSEFNSETSPYWNNVVAGYDADYAKDVRKVLNKK